MFGIQLTFKMGLYFGLVASCLHAIFSVILLDNYIHNKKQFLVAIASWGVLYAFQVLLINCICERISVKVSIQFQYACM